MSLRLQNLLCWLGIFLAGAGMVVLLSLPAWAQHSSEEMQGHDKYHADFYSKWERPNGQGSCCNDSDCSPIDDKYIRTSGEKLEVFVSDRWVEVPKELIRPYNAPDMQSHLCHIGITIYCFVFGGGS